jgi:hypothetical protein
LSSHLAGAHTPLNFSVIANEIYICMPWHCIHVSIHVSLYMYTMACLLTCIQHVYVYTVCVYNMCIMTCIHAPAAWSVWSDWAKLSHLGDIVFGVGRIFSQKNRPNFTRIRSALQLLQEQKILGSNPDKYLGLDKIAVNCNLVCIAMYAVYLSESMSCWLLFSSLGISDTIPAFFSTGSKHYKCEY